MLAWSPKEAGEDSWDGTLCPTLAWFSPGVAKRLRDAKVPQGRAPFPFPFCLPHAPSPGPAEEPAVHTALPRGVLLESILSRALASQLLKGSGAPSPPSSAGSSSLPGAPPSCFTGRAWSLHCRPASRGGAAQAGGMGRAAGSPELGDSSLWPRIHTGLGVLPHRPHSPSLLCLSHI